MLISGIQKFTMLDYPGKTAAIIFTAGCTFRCGYCHNPEFVLPERLKEIKDTFIPEEAVFNFLDTRRGESSPNPLRCDGGGSRTLASADRRPPEGGERAGRGLASSVPLLDGVVISGGEPTVQPDLLPFIRKLKEGGFLVKLDTNGNRPETLKQAVEEGLLDYIAMDIKTSLPEYQALAGKLVSPERIKQSIDLIKNSGVEYEFRSTLIKECHSPEVLEAMKRLVAGAKRYYLQTFRPGHTLLPAFEKYHPFSEAEIRGIMDMFKGAAGEVGIR